jgi:SnoaL-like polyketide cyclase
MAAGARRWIAPFREAFRDVNMEIIELIAEGEKVVGRFRCSATDLGRWRGQPPTGRRFERVDEVYIYRVRDGRITRGVGDRGHPLTRATARLSARRRAAQLDVLPAGVDHVNRACQGARQSPSRG